VLQDRLTSELRLAKAQDLDSANAVLRQFITDYNRRFARLPRESHPAWRPASGKISSASAVSCTKRIVSKDKRRAMGGTPLSDPPTGTPLQLRRSKVQIYQGLDGRVSLYYGQTRLQHSALPGG